MPKKTITNPEVAMNCVQCGNVFYRKIRKSDPKPKYCSASCLRFSRFNKKYKNYKVDKEKWYPKIKEMYETGIGNGEVAELARKMGVYRGKITKIAQENGWISRQYPGRGGKRPWTEEELDLVQKSPNSSERQVQYRLQKMGYSRTLGSIRNKRCEYKVLKNRSRMSANTLAECMGVDSGVIYNFINNGKLVAKRRVGQVGKIIEWDIKPKDVKTFIIRHLPEIDIKKADKYWLIDLLLDGKSGIDEV